MKLGHGSILMLGAGLLVACPDATDRDPPQETEGVATNPFDFTTPDEPIPDLGVDGSGPPTGIPPEITDGGCAEVQVQVDPIIPTLVLLVDQSGSMDSDFSGQPRWDALYETLMDPATGVVTTWPAWFRFSAPT